MDEKLAKNMDDILVGPRLFCESCGKAKVFSPCWSCHYSDSAIEDDDEWCSFLNSIDRECCRGCGVFDCEVENDVCKISEEKKALSEIIKALNKEDIEFCYEKIKILPKEIGEFTNLQKLILNNGKLEELPSTIGNLTHLKTLALNSNRLKKLPVEIGSLVHLETLGLGYNQLQELPQEIAQLTNLSGLYLHNNKLNRLPKKIWQLTSLKELWLNNNQFSEDLIQELREALPNCEIKI